ncbi:MAG: protein translocase subunit SecF [Bacteroidetes bacterium]|nr:MAG: protein translocase subunit SecF [Bacteroidota bacterium]
MEENKEKSEIKKKENWHDRYYKILLIIPVALFLVAIIHTSLFYSSTGDFFAKDISLTGGTSVTLNGKFDERKIKEDLSGKLAELNTREIFDVVTGEKKAIVLETVTDGEETRQILEEYLGYKLTNENSSFEFTGSILSKSFYKQLILALLFAFLFMAVVVFILFRTFVPSSAVIISALGDILMTLTVVNLLGIKVSSAGIVAFLMLVGYSVDTDILLTTRILKRRKEGQLNERIYGAFKTGMTMTLTSLLAMVFAFFIVRSFSQVLTQIFTVLIIGLSFDILNTWITNTSILKWYAIKKKL